MTDTPLTPEELRKSARFIQLNTPLINYSPKANLVGMKAEKLARHILATVGPESELARLRELIAGGVYKVTPLVWIKRVNIVRPFYETHGVCTISIEFDGTWTWTRNDHGDYTENCDSLEDGMTKAEAWHLARVTAPLRKVEVVK